METPSRNGQYSGPPPQHYLNHFGSWNAITQHWQLEGSFNGERRTVIAQVWPPEMCARVIAGICSFKKAERGNAYPTRIIPEGVVFDCLACKTSRVKTHPAHTRNEEPPLLCRFPHVQPVAYPCPGCKADRPANHSSHTNVEGECRAPEVRRREAKERAGGPVRDPGVRASGDADDRRRQTDDDENPADDPAHDPPPPALEGAASSSAGSHGPMAGADPSHAREE